MGEVEAHTRAQDYERRRREDFRDARLIPLARGLHADVVHDGHPPEPVYVVAMVEDPSLGYGYVAIGADGGTVGYAAGELRFRMVRHPAEHVGGDRASVLDPRDAET